MNSIGNKIRFAFIGSISVVWVVACVILVITQLNVIQNQRIIQTMTMEYSVYSLAEELTRTYNDVVKNQGNSHYTSQYNEVHTKLINTLETLKKTITRKESQRLLIGVENTVRQVIRECDEGITEVKNNNFQNFSDHFANAHKYNSFVLENTRTLLQKELEYLSTTQEKSQRTYIINISLSATIFLLVILSMLFFSKRFTLQLITPLTQLSIYAKSIAQGNIEMQTNRDTILRDDEIGSLTQSIYTMVDKLILMISQEKRISEAMKQTSKSLSESNQELQMMNSVMIGRELKMIELKKEIEALKAKYNT